MQRVFTETLTDARGAVVVSKVTGRPKFPRGLAVNYPRATWQSIERTVGRPIDSFSRAIEGAVEGESGPAPASLDAPADTGAARVRRRLRTEE